jgi:hypothetical protein
MATDLIDTPSYPDRSSAPGRCAAQELNAEQRPPRAGQVLARTESVTERAGRHPVSRRFVSQQAAQGAQALAPQAKDEEGWFDLPVPKAWLPQGVLGLVVLCHRSWRGVIACFRDLLEGPVSLGSVHALGRPAVSLAQHINPAQALGRGRAGSHDELGRPAGGAGLALESTSCDRLAAVAHRDAEPGRFICWTSPRRACAPRPPSRTADAAGGPVKRWPGPGCLAMGMSFTAYRSSPA